jgi:hypothetical protein
MNSLAVLMHLTILFFMIFFRELEKRCRAVYDYTQCRLKP